MRVPRRIASTSRQPEPEGGWAFVVLVVALAVIYAWWILS